MTVRGRWPVAALPATALATVLAIGCATADLRHGWTEALEAGIAGLLAALAVAVAGTLPGLTWRGLLFGGVFVTAGVLSWSLMDEPLGIWVVLGLGGAVFLVLAWPWLAHLPALPRLGGFWLGVAYWLLGIIGALVAARLGVAVERILYAGVFGLAVMAAVASARRGRDHTVGVAAAFLVAIAVLLVVGSGTVFDEINPVPDGPWGAHMAPRFWGGEHLFYHPNSLALIGVVVAVRVGTDPAFAAWQRVATVALAGVLIYLTESRTAFGVLGVAGVLHGLAAVRWDVIRYPSARVRWAAVALPFVVIALVLAVSGGQGFLFKTRYDGGPDITSGRTKTWAQVGREWRDAGIGDKLFGDTQTTRAVVDRDGNKLPTDNAAVGSVRRGGVLGVLAFVLGLYLIVRRSATGLLPETWAALVNRLPGGAPGRAPPWLPILVLSMVPAIAVTDWLLGGTGGTLWIMLVVAEAGLLFGSAERGDAGVAVTEAA